MLENTVLVSRNKWKHVADLKMDWDTTLPLVRCLAGELNQVFLNLIVNAADAISSALREDPARKGQICITSRFEGSMAEVRVSDNGTGIPKEIESRVFDPFFTTKDVAARGRACRSRITSWRGNTAAQSDSKPNLGQARLLL